MEMNGIFLIILITVLVTVMLISLNSQETTSNELVIVAPVPSNDFTPIMEQPSCVSCSLDNSSLSLQTNPSNPVNYYSDGAVQVLGENKGKIILGDSEFVGRYNSDGTVDSDFGTNGWIDLGGPLRDFSCAVDLQDRIIISVRNPNNGLKSVIRLLPNGDFDLSFGTNGVTDINFPGTNSSSGVKQVLVNPEGEIFGLHRNQRVFKLTTEGILDENFGANGIIIIVWDVRSSFDCEVMDYYQGSIYLALTDADVIGPMKIDAKTGLKDFSYGDFTDKFYNTPSYLGYCDCSIRTAGIAPDGSFYMGGYFTANWFSSTCSHFPIGVVKFDKDGLPDSNFGTNGIVVDDRDFVFVDSPSWSYAESYRNITFGPCSGNLIMAVAFQETPSSSWYSYVWQVTPEGQIINNVTDAFPQKILDNYSEIGFPHPDGKFITIGNADDLAGNSNANSRVLDCEELNYARQTRPW